MLLPQSILNGELLSTVTGIVQVVSVEVYISQLRVSRENTPSDCFMVTL